MTSPSPTAPWVRTRLRSARAAALLAAALAFGLVFFAAALPRALDRGADQALRQYLRDSGPAAGSLLATAPSFWDPKAADLDHIAGQLVDRVHGTLRLAPGGPVYGTRAMKARDLGNPELARPEFVSPKLDLLYLHDVAAHARLVAGQWPTGSVSDGTVPIAISDAAARTLGTKLGAVLDGGSGLHGPQRVTIVGLYTVNDTADPFWADLPCLARACAAHTDPKKGEPPLFYWRTAGVVGPGSLAALASWGEQAEDFWRLPVDTDALRADQLADTEHEAAGLIAGPDASALVVATGRADLRITSQLPELFGQARARQAAAAPLAAIGPAGAIGVAVVVLCLAAALAADRRKAELELLSARGGSRTGVLRRLLAESAVTTLPAALGAAALALLLLPTPRWGAAALAATATGLFALCAFPLRVTVPKFLSGRAAGRRRPVAELLVLAATSAAVFELRRRGVAPAGQGLDLLLVCAPLLLALTGALALARIQPALVGGLARWTGRRPGLIGFLGLARAARGTGTNPRPSVLPLFALVLAVTTAGFGATALGAITTARHQAARHGVGADVSVVTKDGLPLPDGFAAAAAALPGAHDATAVWTQDEVLATGSENLANGRITVLAVDPVRYAAIARSTGHAAIDPAVLGGAPGADGVLPALVTPDVAASFTGTLKLQLNDGGELRARMAGTIADTPTVVGSKTPVVMVPAGPATAQLAEVGKPTQWFALGNPDVDRLRALLGKTQAQLRTSGAEAAELGRDPLQHNAERLFWSAVLAAAGFALLAVLLALVRAAPDRAALLARLRTMGLRPREGLALILVEALPQAFTATAVGALVAAGSVALLGPAVDLSAMVGTAVATGLSPAALPVLTQALGLAALIALGVLAEAAVFGRRQITTELRAGDSR
ncbi:hypothetical protein [Kitasatospora sp. McL0602]|uniref:hypothetical protein n=1 Tax=Kitasatospora sp. McL0602 TaxID=3439530 RepID=UPI003F8882AE